MKIRSLVVIFFGVLMAQSAFAGPFLTGCVDGPNDTFFAQYACTLYHEAGAYPLSLEPYFDVPSIDIAANYLGPGYIIFTTDHSDVVGQSLTDPGAFQDILFFDNDVALGTASDEVQLYWSGTGFPSTTTISTFFGGGDFLVLDANNGGAGVDVFTQSSSPSVVFTVDDNLPASVPEPSTLVMVFSAGVGALLLRRRRRNA